MRAEVSLVAVKFEQDCQKAVAKAEVLAEALAVAAPAPAPEAGCCCC